LFWYRDLRKGACPAKSKNAREYKAGDNKGRLEIGERASSSLECLKKKGVERGAMLRQRVVFTMDQVDLSSPSKKDAGQKKKTSEEKGNSITGGEATAGNENLTWARAPSRREETPLPSRPQTSLSFPNNRRSRQRRHPAKALALEERDNKTGEKMKRLSTSISWGRGKTDEFRPYLLKGKENLRPLGGGFKMTTSIRKQG